MTTWLTSLKHLSQIVSKVKGYKKKETANETAGKKEQEREEHRKEITGKERVRLEACEAFELKIAEERRIVQDKTAESAQKSAIIRSQNDVISGEKARSTPSPPPLAAAIDLCIYVYVGGCVCARMYALLSSSLLPCSFTRVILSSAISNLVLTRTVD